MNKVSSLADRMKSQIQRDQEAIEEQTKEALQLHNDSLRQLSSDAVNTTRAAIKKEIGLLLGTITNTRTQTEMHLAKLPRLIWMAMLVPLVVTAALCAVILVGTWLYLPAALMTAQTERIQMPDGRTATIITSPGWTMCKSDGQSLPCIIK